MNPWFEWEARAARALAEPCVHLTDVRAPNSPGAPQEYHSTADYWWPDDAAPDGLPYVRRDGRSNPDGFFAHRLLLRKMAADVCALVVAYLETGRAPYAQKACRALTEFFLDPATGMRPHLSYAQAIPGVCAGRGIGIIDTLHLVTVPFALMHLRRRGAADAAVWQGMRGWFGAYLAWLCDSDFGRQERAEGNNHGVCWYVQAAAFASLTGDERVLAECRAAYQGQLLAGQMAADGSFPGELARTKPYGYSIFTLDNMVTLCQILSTPGRSLWEVRAPGGADIWTGLAFMLPYLQDRAAWPYARDVEAFDAWPVRMSFMLYAGQHFGWQAYRRLYARLPQERENPEVLRNIAICQPGLLYGWQ